MQLRDVTVVAADCVTPDLAARALELCLDRCDFGDAVLFSDTAVSGRFRHHPIAPLRSIADYSRFCLRDLPKLTDSPFVLVVQWDGYVVAPEEWANSFRKYDYIGAVVHHQLGAFVGNGGFSLRSRRLLAAQQALPPTGNLQEDEVICRIFGGRLEREFGIRFAPQKVAERFSYETRYSGRATFGFHGPSNFWRHESDDEVIGICRRMPKQWLVSFYFFGLIKNCLEFQRRKLAEALYALAREDRGAARLRATMAPTLPRDFVGETLGQLESSYGGA